MMEKKNKTKRRIAIRIRRNNANSHNKKARHNATTMYSKQKEERYIILRIKRRSEKNEE